MSGTLSEPMLWLRENTKPSSHGRKVDVPYVVNDPSSGIWQWITITQPERSGDFYAFFATPLSESSSSTGTPPATPPTISPASPTPCLAHQSPVVQNPPCQCRTTDFHSEENVALEEEPTREG